MAGSMNLFVKPGFERMKFTPVEVAIEIAQILASLLHELGSIEIAESVCGEVSDSTHAPVNILQTA